MVVVGFVFGCGGGSAETDLSTGPDIPVSAELPDALADAPTSGDTTPEPGQVDDGQADSIASDAPVATDIPAGSDIPVFVDASDVVADAPTQDDTPTSDDVPTQDDALQDTGPIDNGQVDPGPEQGTSVDWVAIPGGTYQMGAMDWSESQPVHSVTVPSFSMGKTEVTVAQYQACVTEGTCTAPNSGCTQARYDAPVVCVTWDQSKAFCAFATGRLCSEAEWEYAARNGSAGNKYPWGDMDPTCDEAVWSGSGCSLSEPAAGCSKSAGNDSWGVCDLAGNVWEWMEDDYHVGYQDAPTNGSAWVDSPRASIHVDRGGSFGTHDPSSLRGSFRYNLGPTYGDYAPYLGARCCKSQ